MSLYLLGSGGLGREVLSWIKLEGGRKAKDMKGFVAEDGLVQATQVQGLRVFSLSQIKAEDPEADIIVCIGNSATRKRLFSLLSKESMKLGGYISKRALISPNVTIGKGVIINPDNRISPDVVIGDGSIINCGCGIGHDAKIGQFVTLLGHVIVNGDVVIEDDVMIGSGAILHPGVKIGHSAVVGIGSVIIRNVESYKTVFGNPGKIIPS